MISTTHLRESGVVVDEVEREEGGVVVMDEVAQQTTIREGIGEVTHLQLYTVTFIHKII